MSTQTHGRPEGDISRLLHFMSASPVFLFLFGEMVSFPWQFLSKDDVCFPSIALFPFDSLQLCTEVCLEVLVASPMRGLFHISEICRHELSV